MKAIQKSFAKINIGLRITEKRADGFHNIQTVFYPLSLYDELTVTIEEKKNINTIVMKCDKSYVPTDENNLCVKTIKLFFAAFRIDTFYMIKIDLKKNIPVGGGLGGGSSNAAAVLRFLIKYFNIDIAKNRSKIMETALRLGSDVPFFLIGKPVYAEGRGEQMKILPDFKVDYKVMLVNPNLHVSTKWAYEKLGFKEGEKKEGGLNNITRFIPDQELFKNDFEAAVFPKFHVLKDIKNELINRGAVFASMSGSGATMYGLFDDSDKIKKAEMYFRKRGYYTIVCR